MPAARPSRHFLSTPCVAARFRGEAPPRRLPRSQISHSQAANWRTGGLFQGRCRVRINAPKFVFGRPQKPERLCRRAQSLRCRRSGTLSLFDVDTAYINSDGIRPWARFFAGRLNCPVLSELALRTGCFIFADGLIPIRVSISKSSFSTPSGSR